MHSGQRATITSAALDGPVAGTVQRVGLKVGQAADIEDTPSARVDARIVEVTIGIDEDAVVENLTHLQVDVEIHTENDA